MELKGLHMVTTVGTESTIQDLVQNLLFLEHDAIAAYDSTIEKLQNPSYKSQVGNFREDHLRHIAELRKMA
jgi:rubrerythrin